MRIIASILILASVLLAYTASADGKNPATPIKLRIKNSSNVLISKVQITNSAEEDFEFAKIKAGKTSNYKQLSSLCNCSYKVDITYYKTEHNKVTVKRSCVNIKACDDFFSGNVLLNITSRKLPKDLSSASESDIETEVQFKKEK